MKIFISYAFDEANKWIEEFMIPLIGSLGFDVVSGRHMEGDPIVATINRRQRECDGCIAFTTRRTQRQDGSYETHPWVLHELTAARTLNQEAIEVRETQVRVGDGNDAYAFLEYDAGKRNEMIFALVRKLASWKSNRITIQLIPPDRDFTKFRKAVVHGLVKCTYEIQKTGEREIIKGAAELKLIGDSCSVEIDVPANDVLLKISLLKADNSTAWGSSYVGLVSIPVILS